MRTVKTISTTLLTTLLLALAMSVGGATPAEAHTVTKPSCARAAHAVMVKTPPHSTQQRREAFQRCIGYAASHELQHTLWRCSTLRHGNAHTRWTVRSACKVMATWPHDYSDREAVTVAWCEGTLNPRASNGQYQGTFQMGSGERARWGHGPTLVAQTSAAADYYEYDRDVMGRGGWGPWQCRPGSTDNVRAWGRAPRVLVRYVFG